MSFKGKTKQDIVVEFRNAEILAAARKVFAANGFSGTSVEAIAQEAGIAKGTLYLYYDSKSEIYHAALRNGLVELCSHLKKQVEQAEEIGEKIRIFISTKLSFFEENRDFFKIYYAEFGNAVAHPADTHKDFRELYLEQVCILKSALAEAVRRQKIRGVNPESVAFAINDLTRGLITKRLLTQADTEISKEIEFLYDFIWRGIACRS
jgi:AcrR family transcriptional regulator